MQDPNDSLNFEIFGFKASAVGRFTVVAVLVFLLGLLMFIWAFGPGQIGQMYSHPQLETSAK
ncbi:hypothetical protein HJB89_10785 [Rhizobium sp. NZLR8]|uniref:hypothetical protein n=1 Tax=Rhizobium sp. NZLR8 TaxID=2731104 RepID=UPI001C829250|nr:hypothetical protein [Rhizobium sp. NZLR8]MBX5157610.1 hypothetical protein [Rhizobium sp. NZLR8]